MAFDTPRYGQGGSYSAANDRGLLKGLAVTAGVRRLIAPSAGVMQGDLAVTSTGNTDLAVNIGTGDCFIDDGTGTGFYFAQNPAAVKVTLTANSSGSTRTDIVYVQVTDTGTGNPTIATFYTANSTTVPSKAIGLATIAVPTGSTASTQVQAAWITDIRKKAQEFDTSVTSTSAVASPVSGNLVYDTSASKWKGYNSSGTWDELAIKSATGWVNADMANGYLLTYKSASSSAPASPVAGQYWYQTDTNKTKVYTGSAWVDVLTLDGTNSAAMTGTLSAGTFVNSVRYGCTIRRAAVQSMASSSITIISWDTEDVDSSGYFPGSGTTVTVPAGLGGLYAISVSLASGTKLASSAMLTIVAAGSANQVMTASAGSNEDGFPLIAGSYWIGNSGYFLLNAGDTVQARYFQSSGAAYNVTGRLTMYRVLA